MKTDSLYYKIFAAAPRKLGLEEIAKMLGMATEASQTRVFQEGRAEGRTEGRAEGWAEGRAEEGQTLVVKQLKRKIGEVPEEPIALIGSLPLEKLEALGEALLDFETVEDLENWLQANS